MTQRESDVAELRFLRRRKEKLNRFRTLHLICMHSYCLSSETYAAVLDRIYHAVILNMGFIFLPLLAIVFISLWLDGLLGGPLTTMLLPLHFLNLLIGVGIFSASLSVRRKIVSLVGKTPGVMCMVLDTSKVRPVSFRDVTFVNADCILWISFVFFGGEFYLCQMLTCVQQGRLTGVFFIMACALLALLPILICVRIDWLGAALPWSAVLVCNNEDAILLFL